MTLQKPTTVPPLLPANIFNLFSDLNNVTMSLLAIAMSLLLVAGSSSCTFKKQQVLKMI